MKRPPFIKPGDVIGITAPSFGAGTEPYISRFNSALQKFKERGYKIKTGRTCFKSDGLGISTKPEICGKELTDFYLNPEIKAIISCGGGELMCESMSFVDFDAIKKAKPKWFLGYSDNTNFLYPLATKCSVMGIYGPTITGFGKEWEKPEFDVLDLLEGRINSVQGYDKFQSPQAEEKITDYLSKYIFDQDKILTAFVPSGGKLKKASSSRTIEADGILLGGCLDVINNLIATQFDGCKKIAASGKKIIWALEACDLNPMDIRRSLWHMDNLGMFNTASAFIFGRPLGAWQQNLMGVNQYNAVTDILGKYMKPLILDCDFGHIDPAMPLVIGSETNLYVKGNNITLSYKL